METVLELLEERVAKNSDILDRLDGFVTEAKGGKRVLAWAWDGGKLLLSGGAGAGVLAWLQAHWPLPRF